MNTLLQELDEVLAQKEGTEPDGMAYLMQSRWFDTCAGALLREHAPEIRAALELRAKLGALADDWNRRDKELRERGGSHIYVTDCANELRHALKAAPPAGGQDGP